MGTLCECGRDKDRRSKRCAVCARRSYPIAGGLRPRASDAEVIAAIASSPDLSTAAAQLGLSRQMVTRRAKELGVDMSHMRPGRGRPTPPEQVFTAGTKKRNSTVRKALLQLDPDDYRCNECGINPTWNGKPLVLQLDHINGDPLDNDINNLRWLCPNCHAQTDTFTGKNIKGSKGPRKAR